MLTQCDSAQCSRSTGRADIKKQKKKSELGNERKRETHYPTQKDPKEMLVNEYYSEIHEI